MKNFNGESIKKVLRALGTIIGAAVLIREIKSEIPENDPNICKTATRYSNGYGDAVKAIMDSKMLDSRKTDVIVTLKSDAGAEYYRAVISIIESDMLDTQKLTTIKAISK